MNKLKLRSMLIKHEGYQREPYKDSMGIESIGVGHNLQQGSKLPHYMQLFLDHHGCLEDSMIETLLQQDIDIAIEGCQRLYFEYDKLPEGVQIALADFVFNLGWRGAAGFHRMVAGVVKKDWDVVADEMMNSKWALQVPNRSTYLTALIRKEADGQSE